MKSRKKLLCQLYSPPLSEMILYITFIQELQRTEDKDMPSSSNKEWSILLNPGEQVEPSLVSQELVDQVPQELVRLHSVTCAGKLECSLHSRSGENGTLSVTPHKDVMPLPLHLLPQHAHHLLWLVVIISDPSQNFLSLSTTNWASKEPPPANSLKNFPN